MTDKELYTAVRRLGMKITKTDGEYRVNFRRGKEATAYYTNDKADALGTAKAMMRERLLRAGWTPEAIAAQERSDRSPIAPPTPAEPIPEDSSPAVFGQRAEWCTCAGMSPGLKNSPGIHHDEGCVMFTLPDYGVFGPDD